MAEVSLRSFLGHNDISNIRSVQRFSGKTELFQIV